MILESVEKLSDARMAVLYTTYYMEEAEWLCDRIGIIDGSLMKAEGTRTELVALVGEQDRVTVSATGDLAATAQAVSALSAVVQATTSAGGIALLVRDARDALPDILETIRNAGHGAARCRSPSRT